MSDRSLDEFVKSGWTRYGEALKTLLAFEEELQKRLIAVLLTRKKERRWTKFEPSSSLPKKRLSRTDSEIAVTVEGRFETQELKLIVGVCWDSEWPGLGSAAVRFAGFEGGTDGPTPRAPANNTAMQVPPPSTGWEDRCLAILPKDQTSLEADLDKILDEIERQLR